MRGFLRHHHQHVTALKRNQLFGKPDPGTVERRAWPFREWPALYACLAPIPAVVALLVLLVVTNFQDGVVYRQTWLPLVNPLEEGAAFALLGLVVFCRAVDRYYPAWLSQARP